MTDRFRLHMKQARARLAAEAEELRRRTQDSRSCAPATGSAHVHASTFKASTASATSGHGPRQLSGADGRPQAHSPCQAGTPDLADALRAAINVLRDSAESRRMPSGEPLTAEAVTLHTAAADRIEDSLGVVETVLGIRRRSGVQGSEPATSDASRKT